jgi:hypothetical protein
VAPIIMPVPTGCLNTDNSWPFYANDDSYLARECTLICSSFKPII